MNFLSKDGLPSSTNGDPENQQTTANNLQDENEDLTCCHRATCCFPSIRDILVSQSVSQYLRNFKWSDVFALVTKIGFLAMSYATLYFLIGERMLPGGDVFGFFLLVVFSYVLGWGLAYIPYLNLPPVFGMLLAGIILRNTNFYNINSEIGHGTTSKIRIFCLTFIAIRAGLQLTTSPLLQNPVFVINLATIPCTVEMIVVGICSRYILEYPWSWAFLTGSILACMSSVVTVNCALALSAQGYGEDKGITTLLCTATSIDDVHIISLFTVFYSIVFSGTGSYTEWWTSIPGGIRDLILGFIAGIMLGLFFAFFPHRGHKYALLYRVTGIILGSLMCTTAASTITVTGGGFLAAVILSFVSSTCWRILSVSFDVTVLRRATYLMWHFMQPVLVGVIGADIEFNNWSTYRFGLHLTTICIGLLARGISTFLVTIPAPFNLKEGIFIALSWLPKGTIQAVLAPMAFEQAWKDEDPAEMELAIDVLRLSVVAIVFLAPLGSIIMMATGPILLHKISEEEQARFRRLSYLRLISLQPVIKKKHHLQIPEGNA